MCSPSSKANAVSGNPKISASKNGKYGFGVGSDGEQYLSKDKALYESDNEELSVERITGMSIFGDPTTVLEAKSDGEGNITLDFADNEGYYQQNSKTTYALYKLKCGITNAEKVHGSREFEDGTTGKYKFKEENSDGYTTSVGINWDKVNSVSGQTYHVQSLIRKKGFKWDEGKKKYVRKSKSELEYEAKMKSDGYVTTGKTMLLGKSLKSLPSDLSGIDRVEGDTYYFREKLKNRGFAWDKKERAYIRK